VLHLGDGGGELENASLQLLGPGGFGIQLSLELGLVRGGEHHSGLPGGGAAGGLGELLLERPRIEVFAAT
jgi:hypothetical protein